MVFSTYQSSPQIASALSEDVPRFDLAIADEAHRCAGRAGTEFTTILDPEKITARRRLFMTATPRYYTPRVRHEAEQLDVEVASMDDEETFGPVLHRLTFGEAIERDLLSDYQVAVVGVTDSEYRHWAEQGEFVTTDGERITDARTLAGQIGLAKAMRKYDLRRIVSFHGRVKQAADFANELPEVIDWMPHDAQPGGELWAEHVSGKMSSGRRRVRLRHLRAIGDGERGLLSNARCLAEGVDVPTLDGVAFIDPRRSTIDIIQALGRAIRKAPDKKIGTIVIPVFVDEDADPEDALDDSAFKHIAGRDQGPPRPRRTARRGTRRPASPPRCASCPAEASREDQARPTARGRAGLRRGVRRAAGREDDGVLGVLLRPARRVRRARGTRTGSAGPSRTRPPTRRLGHGNATEFRAGRLEDDMRARLAALPGWTWDPNEASWEDHFAALQRFVEREGHARVPQPPSRGRLPTRQMGQQPAEPARSPESTSRRARLEALPGWAWDTREASWEEGFAALQRFVEREGHARVPQAQREGDFELGTWVNTQRS